MTKTDKTKQLVGEEVVDYIKDGMKVGLGSGSTMYYMIKKLGDRVKEGLDIEGVPTSNTTAEWAKEFGVPLTDFSKVQELDLAIDGADEVDPNLQLIKGGGGALVREKIVAASAKSFYVIVDESKMVTYLGNFLLPIEVLPFGWEVTANKISDFGCEPKIRKSKGEPFITDNGNYILDCNFEKIAEPKKLHEELKSLVGVVETGLFINMARKVMVGKDEKVDVIDQS
ncbi:ribose 5-phosphate isomerase A [Salinibacillus kushneri]|uniref:Ribose-5-phosphate isomerase A n=1 Tax=Salinibacillus kushneri TaxID=237682 RepID=A0A1I0F7A8_9BACI|nr:ribose 5-phosphate isomerase A [Salinibacillus kushneri]SET53961.1 ribose 5-phosphate isomerase A [Salinibacillus kushneri]